MGDTHREANELGAAVLGKVGRRLIPFLALLYFVAFLDRVNIGFAALTMNEDIGLSAAAYGLGAGIFFIGYVIFEVPSNLILARVGARAWIARIMISWGILSAGMAFVSSPMQFYVMRFLLGVAEAGFFPGVIYYLGCWFPMQYRARILGAFFVALPFSGVIGAPLSTWLLGVDGFGLTGWQWMFILEGLPAVVLGFVVLSYLTNRPADAAWLTPAERAWLEGELARERGRVEKTSHLTLLQSLTDIRVIAFGAVYFGLIIGLYAVNFWLPQMVKSPRVAHQSAGGPRHHDSLCLERRRHGALGAAFGPDGRAPLARRSAGAHCRHHAGVRRCSHRFSDGEPRRDRARVRGDLRCIANLLDTACRDPHRDGSRGRHRAHQFDRQHRRILRARSPRAGQRIDGQLRARAVDPGGDPGSRQPHRAWRGPRREKRGTLKGTHPFIFAEGSVPFTNMKGCVPFNRGGKAARRSRFSAVPGLCDPSH